MSSPREGKGSRKTAGRRSAPAVEARGGKGTDAFASPPRTAFGWSAAVHIAALLLFWIAETARPNPPEFVSYEIEIVSPPSAEQGEPAPEEELTVETPEESDPEPEAEPPPPPEPEDEAPPVEEPEPEPADEEPEPVETNEEETPPPTEEEEEAETGVADPDEEAETTGEDINVRMEGLRRDYPAYYNNIIRQIQRCFRPPPGDYRATVRFEIEREGTVSNLSVVQPSGSFQFDMEAMGAAECAGTGGRLGPLPADLPYERLPIEFEFQPAGGG